MEGWGVQGRRTGKVKVVVVVAAATVVAVDLVEVARWGEV